MTFSLILKPHYHYHDDKQDIQINKATAHCLHSTIQHWYEFSKNRNNKEMLAALVLSPEMKTECENDELNQTFLFLLDFLNDENQLRH